MSASSDITAIAIELDESSQPADRWQGLRQEVKFLSHGRRVLCADHASFLGLSVSGLRPPERKGQIGIRILRMPASAGAKAATAFPGDAYVMRQRPNGQVS